MMQSQYYKTKKAFTLIEVLISIALMGIIIVALFSTVTMMRDSNAHLLQYLEKAKKVTRATKVLYLDIAASDGNITIKKDEFTRLCLEGTRNSLYGLSLSKVCWVVLKKRNTLVRIEGNNYRLPTRLEEKVEVNPVMTDIEIFDVYHEKDKVLVFLKQKSKEPISFMVQGIFKPLPKTITSGVLKGFPRGTKIVGGNIVLPNGKKYPVGSKVGKDGQIIPPRRRVNPKQPRKPNPARPTTNTQGNTPEGVRPTGPRYIPSPPTNTTGQSQVPPAFEG